MKLNTVMKTPEQANFNYLVWDIAWFGIANAATSRFLSVYAIRSGAGASELGLISSLPAIGMLLSSLVAVRWRNRYATSTQAIFWPTFWFRFVFLLPALAPFFPPDLRPLWLIASVVIPSLAQGVSSVVFIALMRESVDSTRVTQLLSRRFVAFNLTVGLGVLGFGAWLEKAPFPVNYQVMFLTAFLASMVSQWYVTRIHPLPALVNQDTPHKSDSSPWRYPGFQKSSLLSALTIIAYFSVFPMVSLRLVDDLEASEGFVAMFGVFELLGGAIMANLTPHVVTKIGARNSAGVAMLSTAFGALVVAFANELPVTLLGAFFLGGGWTATDISQFTYFNNNAPKEGNARFSQAYYQVTAIALFIGPMIGSQLANAGMDLMHVLIIGACLRTFAGLFALSAAPVKRAVSHQKQSVNVGKG